jgi:hypothetical protein
MLSGSVASSIKGTLVGIAAVSFKEKLVAFPTTKLAY